MSTRGKRGGSLGEQDLLDRRVLVCVGTGGVGKTTVAAAIGVEAARRGRRTLVITIDPARRLADALGAGDLSHGVSEIEAVPGLFAMMLDTKRTFDEVVERYAPSPEALERIYANPIYQNLTDALAGSREYSAMEQLHQLHESGDYDLIVLDTPPSRHALDFLDAPRRLTSFLDSQMLRFLFRPALAMGRVGFRLFRFGSATVLRTMERVSGMEFLSAISEFLFAFEGMLDGFQARAAEIQELLRSDVCGFLLVAGPDTEQVRRAQGFWERLEQESIHLVGLVLNRVRIWPGGDPIPELDEASLARLRDRVAERLDESEKARDPKTQARKLVAIAARQSALARRDAGARALLEEHLPLKPAQVRVIPLFDDDVHALTGLERMAGAIFPSDEPPARSGKRPGGDDEANR